MIDFGKVKLPNKLDKNFVLSKISDSMIFSYYHGPFEMGKVYKSKFRKDHHASCGFYVSPKGKLIYNDISRREKLDCFDYVQKLYNITFKDAIEKVALDFGLITGIPSQAAAKVIHDLKDFDKTVKKETKIHFEAGKWTEENLAYWKKYNITKEELKANNIYPIAKLFVNEYKISNYSNELRYALTTEYEGEMRTKIYAPYSDTLKWLTNIPTSHPFGMETLKNKHPFVFLAKSVKCRLVLLKFLPEVIAIQSEQPSAISKQVDKELQFGYGTRYLGADNDETGLEFMQEMEPMGYTPMGLPAEWLKLGIKDYSDLSEMRGLDGVETFLKRNNLI